MAERKFDDNASENSDFSEFVGLWHQNPEWKPEQYPKPRMQFASHDLANYKIFWLNKEINMESVNKLIVDVIMDGFDISAFDNMDDLKKTC